MVHTRYEYGYSDHPTTYVDETTGEEMFDYIWRDADGTIVTYSDIDFRNGVFGDLMNHHNNEIWDELDYRIYVLFTCSWSRFLSLQK